MTMTDLEIALVCYDEAQRQLEVFRLNRRDQSSAMYLYEERRLVGRVRDAETAVCDRLIADGGMSICDSMDGPILVVLEVATTTNDRRSRARWFRRVVLGQHAIEVNRRPAPRLRVVTSR
jgi:hypothetical protein